MSNTITPHVAPVRFEISGRNQELFTLHIDGDVLGIDVKDAWLAAAETMNLDASTTHKGKQLTVYYSEATDVLDIGDWALVLADGVKVTFEITGNAPEENTMTDTIETQIPETTLTTAAISFIGEPDPALETAIVGCVDVGDATLEPMEVAFNVTGTLQAETEAPALAVSETVEVNITQTATYSPNAGLGTQSYFPPAVETQKDVSVGIVASPPAVENTFNVLNAAEEFSKKWNTQPLKNNKRSNAKPADAGQLSQLVREGVGSKAKKKAPLRQAVRSTEAAAHYLAAAIHDFQQPGEDGVDFINTSAIAETRLGKFLDINARVPFAYQNIGEFASVGAFWYFISAEIPDDSLRSLHGTAARNARNRVRSRAVEGFRTLIADATWAKINSDPGLVMALVENDMRFMCFYKQDSSALITQSPVSGWYMPVLEEISNTLKEIAATGNTDLLPDFSFLDAPRQPKGRHYN